MSEVTEVDSGKRKVSRRVEVRAPAATLFALVADPRKHHELDGSGTVRDSVKGPETLSRDAKFSVGMKRFGVPYVITSRVTAFDDGRLIEWRHPLGHRWRWEFEETSPGVTTVTETFDYSTGLIGPMFELARVPRDNANGITKTLEALSARYA